MPTPPLGRADVIFSTADACRVYEYFASRLSAGMIYRKMSSWKLGEEIAPGGSGDSLTLKAVKNLPNSSQNRSFDPEGAPVRDTVMLENGVARAYLGGRMFSSYLGLESSFIPSNFEVSGGTRSEAELRKGPYLALHTSTTERRSLLSRAAASQAPCLKRRERFRRQKSAFFMTTG